MKEIDKTTSARDRKEWRSWLRKNHISKTGIWLIYYKKHTGRASVSYADAVEEAICFGWIDGKVMRIDADRYMQRYTPRTAKSLWSEINIERAKQLIKQGHMTDFGLQAFGVGMKTKERVPSSRSFSVPLYLKKALVTNKKAWDNFQNLSPSAQLACVYWGHTAKTQETRQRRIGKTVDRLARNKKFGEV